MLQLPRVGWRLLACENGASPDCIIVVVVFVSAFNEMSMSTTSEDELAIPELALNSGTIQRSAKTTQPYIATKPS